MIGSVDPPDQQTDRDRDETAAEPDGPASRIEDAKLGRQQVNAGGKRRAAG
jgi:hypothetical protein